MKLYEITHAIESLWENVAAILESGDQAQQAAALAGLEQQLLTTEGTHAQKALDIACLIKATEAEAEAIQSEERKLKQRRAAAQRKSEWLRSYLANNMEPGTNLKDGRASISWRRSATVEVSCAPEALPPSFRRVKTTTEPDKDAIKAALLAGTEVTGCRLAPHFNLQVS